MAILRKLSALLLMATTWFLCPGAWAEDVVSYPRHWQMNFQDAASPVMADIHKLHDLLLILITAISIFVLVLLLYVMWRFSAKRNPVPSKVTHNTAIEVIWTVVPVIILVVIAVPSFKLLYFGDVAEKPEMTLKVTGSQFQWNYEYPDYGNLSIDSALDAKYDSRNIASGNIQELQGKIDNLDLINLETDEAVVVPVDTQVRLLVTATDVIHAFTIPALGFKLDAVPGRLHEGWFMATKTGTFYGQCSELCGSGHGFMPIKMIVKSKADFAAWIAEKQNSANNNEALPTQKVAAAQIEE